MNQLTIKKKYNSIINIDKLKITFKTLDHSNRLISTSNQLASKFNLLNLLDNKDLYYEELIETYYIGNFSFHESPVNSSNHYNIEWITRYKGILLGNLHSDSRFGSDFVTLDFDNQLFYTNYFVLHFGEIINELNNSVNLRFNNIAQIEIALDTEVDVISKLYPIIDSHVNNSYFKGLPSRNIKIIKKYNGRKLEEAKYGSLVPNITVSHPYSDTIYIGNIKNGKQLRIYDKEKYNHDYQKEYFYGHFPSAKTWHRIECTLIRGTNSPEVFDESLPIDRLNDFKFLKEFFTKKAGNLLTFKDLRKFIKKRNGKNKYTEFIEILKPLTIHSPYSDKIIATKPILNITFKSKTIKKENSNRRRLTSLTKDYFNSLDCEPTKIFLKEEIKHIIDKFSLAKNVTTHKLEESENFKIGVSIIKNIFHDYFSNLNLEALSDLLFALNEDFEH